MANAVCVFVMKTEEENTCAERRRFHRSHIAQQTSQSQSIARLVNHRSSKSKVIASGIERIED
jgi:hypothetical protein